MRARLDAGSWARLHCLLIVMLSGGAACLVSFALLTLHLHSMAWRYGLAGLAGYGAFLLLIRGWMRWKGSRLVPDSGVDLSDLVGSGDLPLPLPLPSPGRAANVATNVFRGGRSGGGGASTAWDTPHASVVSVSGTSGGKSGGLSLDLDGDDLFWLLVALAALFAGVIAIAYVIWAAPTLLGEAAVNAAVAGKVYHGLQRRDSSHWTTDVVKRTAIPATILVLSATLAGHALQRVAPEARSIGGVWHHLHRSSND